MTAARAGRLIRAGDLIPTSAGSGRAKCEIIDNHFSEEKTHSVMKKKNPTEMWGFLIPLLSEFYNKLISFRNYNFNGNIIEENYRDIFLLY